MSIAFLALSATDHSMVSPRAAQCGRSHDTDSFLGRRLEPPIKKGLNREAREQHRQGKPST
jgi:hypothetical protein